MLDVTACRTDYVTANRTDYLTLDLALHLHPTVDLAVYPRSRPILGLLSRR